MRFFFVIRVATKHLGRCSVAKQPVNAKKAGLYIIAYAPAPGKGGIKSKDLEMGKGIKG